jgi:hypothetical protein
MNDFTIILPELTDITPCDLKVYDGLDRLWRTVERYKMTDAITITVVDKTARHLILVAAHLSANFRALRDISLSALSCFEQPPKD